MPSDAQKFIALAAKMVAFEEKGKLDEAKACERELDSMILRS